MFYWASPDHFIGSDLVCFFLLMVSLSLHQRNFIWKTFLIIPNHLQSSPGNQISRSFLGSLALKHRVTTLNAYPASRGSVSLAWLLAFTKSFAWLVCRVVGLFTMRQTNHANDFVNAKSHEKRDWTSAFLWLTSTKFRLLRSKMKWRSHKIDNRYKLSLRQSVMMHPFRPSSIPALFFSRRKFKYLHLLPSLATFTSSINSSFYFDRCVVKFFDIPACFLILAAWLLPWFTVQSMHQSAHLSARKSEKKMYELINTCLLMSFL